MRAAAGADVQAKTASAAAYIDAVSRKYVPGTVFVEAEVDEFGEQHADACDPQRV